jgi:SAM-dependent methyltransferase
MKAKGWSAPATTHCVLELLSDLDWPTAHIADVGAGRGHFSRVLGEHLAARGLDPAAHLAACDLIPASFEYDATACAPIDPSGRLPYPDDGFDAVVSIEVVEHVEDQFAFLRELARITKPGGRVVVTTPNTLNANSRLRALLTGFPALYDPLPLEHHDPRTLGGHIHPVSPYYLAYAAHRAGLVDLTFHPDRTKKSAVGLTLFLGPFIALGRWRHRARLARKHPDVAQQNDRLLKTLNGWGLLTCRTAVLRAVKPHPA